MITESACKYSRVASLFTIDKNQYPVEPEKVETERYSYVA
jgi:hypothetical protein